MDIDPRAFGQLEGEVKALGEALKATRETLEQQNKALAGLAKELTDIKTTLAEAKGGWKTLLWIGGASASAAGAVSWILQHLTIRTGM